MLGMPAGSTYTCSKGALFGLNKTLAIEGAPHGIKVSCVSPIAYRPVMKRHIKVFSDDVQHAFKTLYTPEACVPLILALASAKCEVNGQVFTAAGWAVGRNVWGVVEGQREMRTADECLSKINAIATKGSKPVFEPSSMVDFFEFQTAWILGKAYEY